MTARRIALLMAAAFCASACSSNNDGSAAADAPAAGGDGGASGSGGYGGMIDANSADDASVGSNLDAGGRPSWNSNVPRGAVRTTLEAIVGNQMNAMGGATRAGGRFNPGLPNKNAPMPPCSVNGVPVFVEVHGLTVLQSGFATPA